MPSLNRVMLMGNLTRDPEMRYLPSNAAVTGFGLAVNRTWKNQAGEKQEEVTFVDVECFGKMAEVLKQYVHKGDPLYIEGRLKLDQWEDATSGQKRSKMKIIAESFQFLSSGKQGGQQQQPAMQPHQQDGAPAYGGRPDPVDDVIPF